MLSLVEQEWAARNLILASSIFFAGGIKLLMSSVFDGIVGTIIYFELSQICASMRT